MFDPLSPDQEGYRLRAMGLQGDRGGVVGHNQNAESFPGPQPTDNRSIDIPDSFYFVVSQPAVGGLIGGFNMDNN